MSIHVARLESIGRFTSADLNRCVDSRRFFFAGFCFGRRVFVRRVLFRRGFVRQFCYRLCLFTVFFSPFFCSPGCFRRGCFRQVFSPVLFAGVSFVIFVQEGLQLSKWRALKRSVRANNRKTNFPPLKHWILCSEIFVFNYFHQTHRFQAARIQFPSPLFRVVSKP